MKDRQKLGSYTAKGGFKNEVDVLNKIKDYKNDKEAKIWLNTMGYDHTKIKELMVTQIPPKINKDTALSLGVLESNFDESLAFKKADLQIKLEIYIDDIYYIENLSLKKANIRAGYNQVDKRSVEKYKAFWNIPESIVRVLKLYTGEIVPSSKLKLKDPRRMFLDEIEKQDVDKLLLFFKNNKTLIFNDILRGRGALSADWFLVTKKDENKIDWILKDINFVCNFFSQGKVEVTKRGNLKVGRMTVQRKGGTPDPTSLQFKINPLELFENID